VCTTLITFDDIPEQSSTSGFIPNGYKNLNWTNAEYINVSTTPNTSGYRKAVRSSPFVMYNPTGGNIQFRAANGVPFSWTSFYLTSVVPGKHNITIRSDGSTFHGERTLVRSTIFSEQVNCTNCIDIDSVIIEVNYGESVEYDSDTEIIIDDLCISF
jgi:hypothetical protein